MTGEYESLILYRLDELKEDIRSLHEEVCTRYEDHEQRIRVLEHAPKNSNGKGKFWTSIVALASSIVALAFAWAKAGR